MASTEMSNEEIDKMFNAITSAVLGLSSLEDAARTCAIAMGGFSDVGRLCLFNGDLSGNYRFYRKNHFDRDGLNFGSPVIWILISFCVISVLTGAVAVSQPFHFYIEAKKGSTFLLLKYVSILNSTPAIEASARFNDGRNIVFSNANGVGTARPYQAQPPVIQKVSIKSIWRLFHVTRTIGHDYIVRWRMAGIFDYNLNNFIIANLAYRNGYISTVGINGGFLYSFDVLLGRFNCSFALPNLCVHRLRLFVIHNGMNYDHDYNCKTEHGLQKNLRPVGAVWNVIRQEYPNKEKNDQKNPNSNRGSSHRPDRLDFGLCVFPFLVIASVFATLLLLHSLDHLATRRMAGKNKRSNSGEK